MLLLLKGSLACILIAAEPPIVERRQPPVEFAGGSLPALPLEGSLVGAFAGTSHDALIVAGGELRQEAAAPRLSDQILVLTNPSRGWIPHAQRMPEAVAHGSSVSWNEHVLCIGGIRDARVIQRVHRLRWDSGRIEVTALPNLPEAASHTAAVVLDDVLYVAGGHGPDGEARASLWALPLAEAGTPAPWRAVEPWPGPARIAAVAAAQDGSVFVFGGRESVEASCRGLRDGYRYTPGAGWTRIADLPYPVAGTPSPGMALGQSHVMMLLAPQSDGGDGPERNTALLYHTITDTWVAHAIRFSGSKETAPAAPPSSNPAAAPVVPTGTPLVEQQGRAVFVGGAIRSNDTAAPVRWVQPRATSIGLSALDWSLLALYLAAMVGMGLYFFNKHKKSSTRGYFLANQAVPWWAAGISIFATSMSALSFMAIPALVYQTNWVYFLGNMMIVAIAPIIVYFYLPFFRRLGITSAYEYLEKRFGLGARLVGSGAFLLYQLGRMGVVVYLPALALSAVTGMDIYACIVIMGVVATFYTVLGGIEAVIWTDSIQMIVLMGGALLCFGTVVARVPGGLTGIVESGLQANKFHAVNMTWDIATAGVWVVVVGNFFRFLIPYSSDQSVVQRYLTTPSERKAARSIWANAWLSVPTWFMFFALGTALWVFFRAHPAELNPLGKVDEIVPWFIIRELPPGLAGIIIAALFAATMSSLDSSMNSMATAITTDFYQRFWAGSSETASLWIARAATAALGFAGTGFAIYMAYVEGASVWDQFLKIMGLFGGGLGGLFLAGIFTRRTSSRGVLVGFGTSALVLYWVQASGAVHFFLYGAVGMFTCLIVGWLASWVLPDRGKDIEGLTVFTLAADTAAGTDSDAAPSAK